MLQLPMPAPQAPWVPAQEIIHPLGSLSLSLCVFLSLPPPPPPAGTVLMMSLCELVHIYEFLPSRRQTNQCHYYQAFSDDACTLGAYHPLLFEKELVRRMNRGSPAELAQWGRVMLPGFQALNCTQQEEERPAGAAG